jgi:hypothetical protein
MGRDRPPRKAAPAPTVFLNVPHVPNKYKLQDEDGKIIRIPENHLQEVCQLIHQYCPPGGMVLDPCAGSMATLLGAIFLNRNCIVNERDKVCYPLAVARAKLFLHFMMKTKGSQFPGLNVPMNQTWNGINIYEAFFNFMGKKTDTSPGVLDVPKSNKPIGFPSDASDVAKHNKSEGLIVKQSPTLAALDGVTLTKGLFATKAFQNGEFITSLWGAYKLKVPEASSMQVIKMVQDVPKQVNLYMKIDERCAAFYINSPALHEKTKDTPTNCDLMETATYLADPKKIGVFATRDIASGDELWTVYSDISTWKLNGRVLNQETPMSKANKKKKEEEKSSDCQDTTSPKVRSEAELKKGAEGQEAPSMTHEELAMAKRANLIVLAKKAEAILGEAILGVAPRAPAPNEDSSDMVDLTGEKKKKKAVPVPPSVNPKIAANADDENMATDISLKTGDKIASPSKMEQV